MIITGGSSFSKCNPAHLHASLLLVRPQEQTIKAPGGLESQLINWLMTIPQVLLTPFSLLSTLPWTQKQLSDKHGTVLARSV